MNDPNSMGVALLSVLMMFAIVGAYFAPAIIASHRGRANAGAILALNLCLGWTVLGWVCALVWALTDPRP